MSNKECTELSYQEDIRFPFEKEIAEETILYVIKNTAIPDIYHVLKIIYFAGRLHLERYGRLIYGDDFTALKHGPVPQETYNLIKKYRDNNARYPVAVCGNNIKALRDANMDVFSESDIECLDEAISEYGHLSFDIIKNKSHTAAYNKANENDYMKIEDIVSEFKNGDVLLKHLQNPFPDFDNDVCLVG